MKKPQLKHVLIGTLAIGLLAVGGARAFAATAAVKSDHQPFTNLAQVIAEKFNLNQSDVQSVIDDEMQKERAQMEAQHEALFKQRLSQAVTDGKLTQAQADLITQKAASEKTFFESLKDMSDADRKAAMDAHMSELKAWSSANNIPQDFAFFGGFGGHGHHGPDMDGDAPASSAN